MKHLIILCCLLISSSSLVAHKIHSDKFHHIDHLLKSADHVRTASGAPGPEYWQQKVDYNIRVKLDEKKKKIIGSETITYHNRSPYELNYLWLQLDQNGYNTESKQVNMKNVRPSKSISHQSLYQLLESQKLDLGFKIISITDLSGKALDYTINDTMLRIELSQPIKPNQRFQFKLDWNHNIRPRDIVGGRGGYEYLEDDKEYIFAMAQWYPRLCAYTDIHGWQNQPFLGRGEFTLEFGDFDVYITVPEDHYVSSTGILNNPQDVLTEIEIKRLEKAKTAKKPLFIVNPEEANKNLKTKEKNQKTWHFSAKNVRDFAFASSRTFIWDAMGVNINNKTIMAMSFYPRQGEPLWSKYSTEAVAHTLEVYSKYAFNYPYPVMNSVNVAKIGMEYPMMTFNFGRTEKDGTYSKRTKYGMIGVIIHEVGHTFFPMIVNSDERRWTWMDEGINTFLQALTEREWEKKHPGRRIYPWQIRHYMKGNPKNIRPIMTDSHSSYQFGNNAYGKPAIALTILRDSILGHETFDYAFKTYAQRWMFKRPTPADFFRTFEDASGEDLDWFWRGWFYSIEPVDISIEELVKLNLLKGNPKEDKPLKKAAQEKNHINIQDKLDKDLKRYTDSRPYLKDFYNTYDEFNVVWQDEENYKKMLEKLDEKYKPLLKNKNHFYRVKLNNKGGLVMPIIMQLHFKSGKKELRRYPVESWRPNSEEIYKLLVLNEPLESITLDPFQETADIDTHNNHWPRKISEELWKLEPKKNKKKNPMQKAKQKPKKHNEKTKAKETLAEDSLKKPSEDKKPNSSWKSKLKNFFRFSK